MISLARLSANMGRHYYTSDSYYTKEGSIENSEWFGNGARYRKLSGHINPKEFQSLLESHSQKNHKNHSKGRSGLDLTFSAPKSVSLVGLLAGDKNILNAHNNAVNAVLRFVENRYSYTRVGSKENRCIEVSGNICVAKFTHDLSRAKDPQLHTHCVLFNSVKREDGHWRSFHNDGIFNNSKLIGLIYQNELAYRIKNLGYDISIDPNGTFEITGYTKEQIQEFSKRTQNIDKLACQTKKQERIEKLLDRPAKGKAIPRDVLVDGWKKTALDLNIIHPVTNRNIKQHAFTQSDTNDVKSFLKSALNHVTERDVKFKYEELEKFILSHNLGKSSFDEKIYAEHFKDLIKNSEIILCENGYFTTRSCIETEKYIIQTVQFGKGACEPLARHIPEYVQNNSISMTQGQRDALISTLSSTDQFIAWQGVAGAGKTFAMNLVKDECTKKNIIIKGFSISKEAANVLWHESGIPSNTIASLLVENETHAQSQHIHNKKEMWIIDESSLMGAKDCEKLLKIAKNHNVRVIFVGDTKQISSIQAGNPFKLIQQAGIHTSHLTESRRQKTIKLKESVDLIAQQRVKDGLKKIDDRILEIFDSTKRTNWIKNEYLKLSNAERNQTLILSTTNEDKKSITQCIRSELKNRGELKNETKIQKLISKNLTTEAMKYTISHQIGDILIFHRDQKACGIQKHIKYKIEAIDHQKNTISLSSNNSSDSQNTKIKFNPKIGGFTSYVVNSDYFAEGDKICATKNDNILKINNGQDFIVLHVQGNLVTLKSKSCHQIQFETNEYVHFEHNYVNTIYSSQGKTCDRVIISDGKNFNREMLYVALSRAKYDAIFLTENKVNFFEKSEVSSVKQSAFDLNHAHMSLKESKQNKEIKHTIRMKFFS